MHCPGSQSEESSRLALIEAEKIAERFEILNFAAQIRNGFQLFGSFEQDAVEQFVHKRSDQPLVVRGEMGHRAKPFAQKRLALRAQAGTQLPQHSASFDARLPRFNL